MKGVVLGFLLTLAMAVSAAAGGADDLKAANAAADRGDRDEAIRLSTRALAAGDLPQSDQVLAYKIRGIQFTAKTAVADAGGRKDEARRHYESALADLDTAIRIAPDDASLVISRGQIHQLMNRHDQAIVDFETALRLKPSTIGYMDRGDAYRAKGEYDKALADYSAALSFEPKEDGLEPSSIHAERGYTEFLATRYDRAAADFQKALALVGPGQDQDVLWLPYQVAWLHLSRAKAGQNDAEELASNAAKVNLKQWPGLLVAFFLGQSKLEDLMAPASNHGSMGRARECSLAFFLGENALLKGDTSEARRLLGRAREICNARWMQRLVADAELKRLGQ